MYLMTSSKELVSQLRNMLPQYLDMISVSTQHPFNCLNPEHDDKNPSMSFDAKDGQHVKCFSCNVYWDIFDLIALNELHAPVNGNEVEYNFSEAFNKALQIMNINGKPMKTGKSEQKQVKNERQLKIDEANRYVINQANLLLDSEQFNQIKNPNEGQVQSHKEGMAYLQRR